jgi:cation:H+ antiporter
MLQRMEIAAWLAVLVVGTALIVWGAEKFAENLSKAAARLGVGAFALALLLAGAEPEELATVIAASLRDAPGIAFGDIIGSNVAICLVALPVGAIVAGRIPFTRRLLVYALAALPVSALSVVFVWDGALGRLEGLVLVGLYVLYVSAIWRFERAPPLLGEVEVFVEVEEELHAGSPRVRQGRVGVELGIVVAGLAAMALGSVMLVEAVRQITDVEATQTRLGLTVVGFATAFELVMLVFSASRRGLTDVALAGVVGSFGYNMTMSLGAGALVRPLSVMDATQLHWPAVTMLLLFGGLIAIAIPSGQIGRAAGIAALCAYPLFWVAVFL